MPDQRQAGGVARDARWGSKLFRKIEALSPSNDILVVAVREQSADILRRHSRRREQVQVLVTPSLDLFQPCLDFLLGELPPSMASVIFFSNSFLSYQS